MVDPRDFDRRATPDELLAFFGLDAADPQQLAELRARMEQLLALRAQRAQRAQEARFATMTPHQRAAHKGHQRLKLLGPRPRPLRLPSPGQQPVPKPWEQG